MKAVFVAEKNRGAFVPQYDGNALLNGDVCIGAIDENKDVACGYMTAKLLPMDVLRIEYIYVHEDYRRKGAAGCMIRLLKELSSRVGIVTIESRMEYQNEKDKGAEAFFVHEGFSNMMLVDTAVYCLPVSELRDINKVRFRGQVESVRSLSGRSWSRYADLMEDFFPWRSAVDEDYSYIVSDENLNPIGALFASRDGNNVRLISFKTIGDNAGPAAEALYAHAVKRAKESLGPEAMITIEVRNKSRAKMLLKLSEVKPEPMSRVLYLTYNLRGKAADQRKSGVGNG